MENLKVKTVISELADNEEFRDIEGFENLYRVSNQGRVYSVKNKKFLKPNKNEKGYLRIWLCKNGKRKAYKIHRLVAQAFIPNPLNLLEVNHINEAKTDNHVENLEWMSHKENCNYGTRNQRVAEKLSKPVLQFTLQGDYVAEYSSTIEAARAIGIFHSNISSCCNGSYKSAGGFIWRYKEEVA